MKLDLSLRLGSRAILAGGVKPELAALREVFALAAQRPVDFIGIGDSNEFGVAPTGGTGFDHGLGKALAARFGLYASPIYAQEITGTQISLQGFATSGTAGVTNSAVTGADAGLDSYKMPSNFPYCYQASGDMGQLNGVLVSGSAADGLNVSANLRAHYCYATFNSGSGSFRPAVRLEVTPFTILVNGSVINTNTGSFAQLVATLDLPAAARSDSIGFKWRVGGGTASAGPTLERWMRVENRDRLSGIAFSSLYGVGGQSLYDMAAFILAETDQALTNYFAAARHIQVQRGQSPIIVMYVNSGMNDRNETLSPSLGPNPSNSPTSAAAYIDNLDALRNRIEAIWTANGWPLTSLYWLIVPSHRIADPQNSQLVSYGDALLAWQSGKPRVAVARLDQVTTYAEKFALTHYAGTGQNDPIHQLQAGYEYDGAKIVAMA